MGMGMDRKAALDGQLYQRNIGMQLQSNEFGRKGTDALTSLKTQKPMQFTDLSWTDAMPKTLFNFQQMSCPAVPMTEDETARADAALAETETLESAE